MADQTILDGGLQYVPAISLAQIIYLDFDGELTSYNGEILTLDNVEVQDALLTAERINNIVTSLNERYASKGIQFVTQRPATADYSTIFVGKTDAFDQYGTFKGLAETIDEGNLNKTDKAFVNLDSTATDTEIINTISHETDHLTGTLNHGGEGLNAYADRYPISSGKTSTGITLRFDSMYIDCGGTANNTSIDYSGSMTIASGGVANRTTVKSQGRMYISGGGEANSTTVNNWGMMYISSGGIANSTTVNSGGWMSISSGGTATNVIWTPCIGRINVEDGAYVTYTSRYSGVYFGSNNRLLSSALTMDNKEVYDFMYVMSGGLATGTSIQSDGKLIICSGGEADSTSVNYEGNMTISSGGLATDTTINLYGNMYIVSGGAATGTTVNYSACMTIYSGGEANSAIVDNLGTMVISSGGTATNITASSKAHLSITVASDTYIQGTLAGAAFEMKNAQISGYTVNAGYILISSGGEATGTTINSGGNMIISGGGSATNTIVNTFGSMSISNGGVATGTTVNSYGVMRISSGGTASIVFNPWQGNIFSVDGATVEYLERDANIYIGEYATGIASKCNTCSNFVLSSGLSAIIYSGGSATGITVNTHGVMYISGGGTAHETVLSPYGSMTISSGGVATGTTVNNSGFIDIYNSGIANSTIINYHGGVDVYYGGMASRTTVDFQGWLRIHSGGSAVEIVENGGEVYVEDGAYATFASNTIEGFLLFTSEGMTVHQNTIANGTIMSGGEMNICSGGVANNTSVFIGYHHNDLYRGTINISSGGTAKNTTVNSGGSMCISSGGMHCGSLQIANGAAVSAVEGSIIDFTLVDRSVNDDYLISDISLISGAPTYTITVSANQASGTYKLAQGAEIFTGTIAIGSDGSNYGTLSVNRNTLQHNDISYSLIKNGGDLTLTISGTSSVKLSGDKNGVSFTGLSGNTHVVDFSKDNFSKILILEVSGDAVDTYNLPAGTYQWQVDDVKGDDIVSNNAATSQKFISDADGDLDLFFGNANSVWENGYAAEHQGVLNSWNGTGEQLLLDGRNKIADVFTGSADANILVLTDYANGDAIFVDDVFTAFGKDAARLSQIDEIRAGYGDDIVDMTSQKFAYSGDGVTIYGGAGNDTIWANNGENTLFGDAGNDRIVGGAGNDYIIGGGGNDSMHGGGGNDIFCFGGSWGNDTIEQLAGGSVTLWFEEGDDTGWNVATRTYSDGTNTVSVSGSVNVMLRFGASADLPAGSFEEETTRKVFEDKGMLA